MYVLVNTVKNILDVRMFNTVCSWMACTIYLSLEVSVYETINTYKRIMCIKGLSAAVFA